MCGDGHAVLKCHSQHTACLFLLTTSSWHLPWEGLSWLWRQRGCSPSGCGHLGLKVKAHSSNPLPLARTRHLSPSPPHAVGVRWEGQALLDARLRGQLTVSAMGLRAWLGQYVTALWPPFPDFRSEHNKAVVGINVLPSGKWLS